MYAKGMSQRDIADTIEDIYIAIVQLWKCSKKSNVYNECNRELKNMTICKNNTSYILLILFKQQFQHLLSEPKNEKDEKNGT